MTITKTTNKIHTLPSFNSADFEGQYSRSLEIILEQKVYPSLVTILLKRFMEDPEIIKMSSSPMERKMNSMINVLQQMGEIVLSTKKSQEQMSENQLATITHLSEIVNNVVDIKAKMEVGSGARIVTEQGETRIENNIVEETMRNEVDSMTVNPSVTERLDKMEEKVNSIYDILQTIASGGVSLVTSGQQQVASSYSDFSDSKSMHEVLSEDNTFDPSMFDMGDTADGLEDFEDFTLDMGALDIIKEMTGK